MADNPTGCIEQIPNGVVPNQYGSWPFGRAGWCPGLDVKPWVADITSSVAPGSNQMTYRGLFQGGNYVPRPNPNPPGGFGANITMNAWLVVWESSP